VLPTRATCPLRPASAADRPNRTRRTTARKGNRRQGGVEVHSGGCHCSALASTLVFCLGGYITKTPQPPQGGMSIRRADEVVKHVTVRGSSISTSFVFPSTLHIYYRTLENFGLPNVRGGGHGRIIPFAGEQPARSAPSAASFQRELSAPTSAPSGRHLRASSRRDYIEAWVTGRTGIDFNTTL